MKRILVIGATSAIAVACLRRWAQDGATQLFLVARDEVKLNQTAADLRIRGAEVHTRVMDANAFDAHGMMLQAATMTLGTIDIALIACGSLADQFACEQDANEAIRQFQTNATSTIALLTRLATVLETQRSGCLAAITSVAGDRGRPTNYVYGSAKAAVSTFCEGLRARLYRAGVHVVDIRPGFVATPMTHGLPIPAALLAQPEAVAKRIVAGVERKADVLYVPAFWALIMLVVRNIPGFMFKRMRL